MSKYRFDSAQMLPLFQIISPHSRPANMNITETSMPATDIPPKHKRKTKRPDVPVHRSSNVDLSNTNDNIPILKTFGANYHGHKTKHKHEKVVTYQNEDQSIESKISEEGKNTQKPRIKRKQLMKEIDRITLENINLVEQFTLLQNALTKKDSQVLKLKEKISSVQNINKDLLNENNVIKSQYQDILINLEEFKSQLKTKLKCSMCEELQVLLKKQAKDIEISKSATKELNEDLNMLKNVIYRLNVQLERYQQKLKKPNALISSNNTLNMSPLPGELETDIVDAQINNIISHNIDSESFQHNDHFHTPISWGNVNSHTLGPLLDAYQDTVKEKEEIIKKYELELVNFTEKLKSIIEENEILHKKNIEESETLKKNVSELEDNRKELKITKEQNDLLIKKCALKHDKLQEICKVYDHKIESMKRDYDVLQDQYHKTRVDLSSLQGKYQSVVDVNDSLKSDKQNVIPLSVHTTSVNECKRLFEELKTQYDNEKSKLLNQIKLLEQHSKDLNEKVVEIGAEKRELQIKVRTAEKHIKKLETKLVEKQNSLTHIQISRDACKRQLGKAIEFGRELVTEQESLLQQLSSRQKENKAVKQIGSTMASRMDILKSQLKTVQKDAFQQLASVEQRIQEQDSSMDSMRRDHESEVEKLLREIHDKDEYISRLIEQTNTLPPAPYLLYREKHMHLS